MVVTWALSNWWVKAELQYETQFNSTVVADKEPGPVTVQSCLLALEFF